MIDETDRLIIKALKENGRMMMKELGKSVHLTGQAAANRVMKLEEQGIIEGYTIKVNNAKIGKPIQAFLNIYTRGLEHKPLLDFFQNQDCIQNIYKISGEGCYMIEVFSSSHQELDTFLEELSIYANYKVSIILNSLMDKL
ncbi:Lrp/AsnC family transcriptional regulator [Bacillus salitolerans]|uniref:Lrp/AsnC family transcriptional regulator n=1 Tax=Bacillus salitolerans TaxID=1437434 RepID=A0ABW4LWM5_9BACI